MLKYNHIIYHLITLISLFLSACNIHTYSSISKNQTSLEWHTHQQLILQLTKYQAHGTFAYVSNKQKIYTRFNWQKTNTNNYRLILINLFGNIEMDLNLQNGVVQLVNKEGKCCINNNPNTMIQKLTGMIIPFNDLCQWILGLPGKANNFTLNSYGYIHTLNYIHNGQCWKVIYQDYHSNTVPALPKNLELQQDDQRIKLKINSWSF